MEIKKLKVTNTFSLKEIGEDGSFSGYASVFDVIDSHYDIITRGAFTNTISRYTEKGRMPSFLWQHNGDEPIGIITLLREDERGLYMEGKLALDTQRGKEAYSLLKMGALNGLSIGYSPVRYTIEEKTGVRKLTEVELWEVSLVTFPANDSARVTQVKTLQGVSVEMLHKRKKDIEAALCDAGASDSVARFVASQLKPPAECDAQGDSKKAAFDEIKQALMSQPIL